MFADSRLRPLRYVGIALLVAALPALAPNPFFLNLAQEVALLAIAGIGLNFLLGLSGQISLGQAGFLASPPMRRGCWRSAWVCRWHGRYRWPSWPAVWPVCWWAWWRSVLARTTWP